MRSTCILCVRRVTLCTGRKLLLYVRSKSAQQTKEDGDRPSFAALTVGSKARSTNLLTVRSITTNLLLTVTVTQLLVVMVLLWVQIYCLARKALRLFLGISKLLNLYLTKAKAELWYQ